MISQDSAQMMQTSFTSAVSKGLQRRDPQPVDTANVDDPSRVARRSSLLEQGREKLGEVEHPVEIESEDPCPGGRWVFIIWGTPVRSRVVDENVKLW